MTYGGTCGLKSCGAVKGDVEVGNGDRGLAALLTQDDSSSRSLSNKNCCSCLDYYSPVGSPQQTDISLSPGPALTKGGRGGGGQLVQEGPLLRGGGLDPGDDLVQCKERVCRGRGRVCVWLRLGEGNRLQVSRLLCWGWLLVLCWWVLFQVGLRLGFLTLQLGGRGNSRRLWDGCKELGRRSWDREGRADHSWQACPCWWWGLGQRGTAFHHTPGVDHSVLLRASRCVLAGSGLDLDGDGLSLHVLGADHGAGRFLGRPLHVLGKDHHSSGFGRAAVQRTAAAASLGGGQPAPGVCAALGTGGWRGPRAVPGGMPRRTPGGMAPAGVGLFLQVFRWQQQGLWLTRTTSVYPGHVMPQITESMA